MGPTQGSSIQGVGKPGSNRLLMDWGIDFKFRLINPKLAVCFISYLDVWVPGEDCLICLC